MVANQDGPTDGHRPATRRDDPVRAYVKQAALAGFLLLVVGGIICLLLFLNKLQREALYGCFVVLGAEVVMAFATSAFLLSRRIGFMFLAYGIGLGGFAFALLFGTYAFVMQYTGSLSVDPVILALAALGPVVITILAVDRKVVAKVWRSNTTAGRIDLKNARFRPHVRLRLPRRTTSAAARLASRAAIVVAAFLGVFGERIMGEKAVLVMCIGCSFLAYLMFAGFAWMRGFGMAVRILSWEFRHGRAIVYKPDEALVDSARDEEK